MACKNEIVSDREVIGEQEQVTLLTGKIFVYIHHFSPTLSHIQ